MQEIYVNPGSFQVDGKKNVLLKAILGTGVGIALHDARASIGGLLSVILPEPPDILSTSTPLHYAATGLPLLIAEMLERGASRERLEAGIAGGALICSEKGKERCSDIGERTAELVKVLLLREGISINSSETGGLFSSVLTLNLKTFTASLAPITTKPSFPETTLPMPGQGAIEEAIEHLKPIPQVALKVLRMLDEEYDLTAISRELLQDQVMTAKILQLCNSAMYAGTVIKLDSLDSALLRLGEELFIKTLISASLGSFYNQIDSSYSLCKGGLYQHAVGTALIAEKLASITGKASPAAAYTAGLLHDIGMVVLDQYMAPQCGLFYRELQQEKKNMLEMEETYLTYNHCEAGRELAGRWDLHPALASTIGCHHTPEKGEGNEILPFIVYLADLLMNRFNGGLTMERVDAEKLELRMGRLDLTVSQLPEIIDSIPIDAFGSTPELALGKKV